MITGTSIMVRVGHAASSSRYPSRVYPISDKPDIGCTPTPSRISGIIELEISADDIVVPSQYRNIPWLSRRRGTGPGPTPGHGPRAGDHLDSCGILPHATSKVTYDSERSPAADLPPVYSAAVPPSACAAETDPSQVRRTGCNNSVFFAILWRELTSVSLRGK